MPDKKFLGTFNVESGCLIVTDPCYEYDPFNVLLNVQNGTWIAEITTERYDGVTQLYAHRTCFEGNGHWRTAGFIVHVDSGQAGIFDAAHFDKDEDVSPEETFENVSFRDSTDHTRWYKMCCDRTLGPDSAGVIPFGAVSASGWGDGGYECEYFETDDGLVTAVRINYIYQDYEEDEDEEEYDDE